MHSKQYGAVNFGWLTQLPMLRKRRATLASKSDVRAVGRLSGRRTRVPFCSTIALVVAGCAGDPMSAPPSTGEVPLPPLVSGDLAIVGVGVVSMRSPDAVEDQTVLVRDGIIAVVAPSATVEVPAGTPVIDGRDLWLMPGLIDMHVHLRRDDLSAYAQAGITTVRNMWGTSAVRTLMEEAAAGAPHPTIYSAAPGLDGSPAAWPGTVLVNDPDEAAAAVGRLSEDGWNFIKIYNQLQPTVLDEILKEAEQVGVRVVGHVPLASDVDAATAGGLVSIEHLTGIAEAVADGRSPRGWLSLDQDRLRDVASLLADRAVWVCPTLVVLDHLARSQLSASEAAAARLNQQAAVAALHEAGVPLLAGTDAGIDLVSPGTSLTRELELLVEAGLTPYQALTSATSEPARFLGRGTGLGMVAEGMQADLVLLSANPLVDIAAVRLPVGLVQRGLRIF